MKYLLALVILLIPVDIYAGDKVLKHNPYSNKWEYVEKDEVIKHNPYNNEWSYEDKDSEIKHNPYENEWSYE